MRGGPDDDPAATTGDDARHGPDVPPQNDHWAVERDQLARERPGPLTPLLERYAFMTWGWVPAVVLAPVLLTVAWREDRWSALAFVSVGTLLYGGVQVWLASTYFLREAQPLPPSHGREVVPPAWARWWPAGVGLVALGALAIYLATRGGSVTATPLILGPLLGWPVGLRRLRRREHQTGERLLVPVRRRVGSPLPRVLLERPSSDTHSGDAEQAPPAHAQ